MTVIRLQEAKTDSDPDMDARRQPLIERGRLEHLRTVAAPSDAPAPIRYRLSLPGRVLLTGSDDAGCNLVWVQGRSARVSVDKVADAAAGARAILYLDLVGRIEGVVSRVGLAELDVDLTAPSAKWVRLEQQFAVLAAMAPKDRENIRGHRRIALEVPDVAVSLADGRTHGARIRDISRSGAAVRSGVAPEIGTLVTLGSTRGKVVRLLDDGFAVQFLRLLPLEWFTPAYVL